MTASSDLAFDPERAAFPLRPYQRRVQGCRVP